MRNRDFSKLVVTLIPTHDRPPQVFKALPATPELVVNINAWCITNFIIKKLKFSAQRSNKTRDFQMKNSIRNLARISQIPRRLRFSVPRP